MAENGRKNKNTDKASAYQNIPRSHETVKHGASEFVRGMANTNGLESHRAMFKRAIDGTFHHISVKHLPRHTMEFEGSHNARPIDTAEQMGIMAQRMTYKNLIASSGERNGSVH